MHGTTLNPLSYTSWALLNMFILSGANFLSCVFVPVRDTTHETSLSAAEAFSWPEVGKDGWAELGACVEGFECQSKDLKLLVEKSH